MDITIFHKISWSYFERIYAEKYQLFILPICNSDFFPPKNCINMYSFKLIMTVLIQCLCHAYYVSLVRHCILSFVFIWLQGYITEHVTVTQNIPFKWTTCQMFSLTPWSGALLEKLINSNQPVKSFFGIRRFVTAFTRARIQSACSHRIPVTSILMLLFQVHLHIPSGLFLLGYQTRIVYG
jgi:hypothetical protein